VAFGVTVFPYLLYVRLHTGEWMVSEKVGMAYEHGFALGQQDYAAFDRLAWGLDSSGTEVRFFSPESYTLSLEGQIRSDFPGFVRLLRLNGLRFVQTLSLSRFFPALLFPLVALGLFRLPWDRRRLEGEGYLLASTAAVLSFILFQVLDRYIAPLLILFVLWLAKGLVEWGSWAMETAQSLAGRKNLGIPAWLLRGALPVLVAAFLVVLQFPVQKALNVPNSFRPEHRSVGEWLATQTDPDEAIMSRYPAIAFHADRRWVATANATLSDLRRYAQEHDVDYFAVAARELPLRPQFAPLVEGEAVPSWLKLVAVHGEGSDLVAIYQMAGDPADG
jgi:hypothetical protein